MGTDAPDHIQSADHTQSPERPRFHLAFPVDGDEVPVPHFGVLLDPSAWTALATRLTDAGATFVIEPHTRFAGAPGEQSTMFLLDPAGNALEFKAFADDRNVFAR